MSLVRWRSYDPWQEYDALRRYPAEQSAVKEWQPRVDIVEESDAFYLSAELPGIDKNDVKVTVENHTLTIAGEKKSEREIKTEDGGLRRIERVYGEFSRSFRLAQSVDTESIEASYDKGVLSLKVPKRAESKAREIDITIH